MFLVGKAGAKLSVNLACEGYPEGQAGLNINGFSDHLHPTILTTRASFSQSYLGVTDERSYAGNWISFNMADAEEKAKAEKLAAAKKRVEEMKKKKAKKAGAKKEEKTEAVAEASKSEETPETPAEAPTEAPAEAPAEALAPQETKDEEEKKEEKLAEASEHKDEEKVSELNSPSRHERSPSLSVQSKMRSSSFRQASGPLSPDIAFSPSGDTAPDIYRKQALRIEDLERENKRLSKEVGDGEKRWKKAEEELEDLREADGESTKGDKSTGTGSSEEVEKLVSTGA
ncbi:hypothetical protein NHQ30_007242 [Ciborinia camelliae]|nr:hypothetical protein NHQ30_007242 [Ciborinia camelliae]